jgi:DNA polymerase-1
MPKAKLFLLDGSAIFYRSYFAFIRNPLINSKGENTSATFGFLNTVFKIIEDERPEYLAVVFDTKEPTFRHEIYDQYKATREKMPEDMVITIPRMMHALKTLNLPLLEKPGFEADDIIATLSNKYASTDLDVFIVSGDKDLAQLINDHVKMYAVATPPVIMGREEIKEKYGIFPEQVIDWLALMGDSSDNVPGVPSVGQKTAVSLLETYDTLENLYKNLEELPKKNIKEKLIENHDLALLSKKLVTLDDNVELEHNLNDLVLKGWDKQEVEVLLKDMEFNRLVTRSSVVNDLIGKTEVAASDDIETKSVKYILVNDQKLFNELLRKWKKVDEFVFDLETDSLDTFIAKIAGIAICFDKNNAYYIAVNHTDSKLNEKEVLDSVKPIFENKMIKKCGQNIKYDTMILRQHNIGVQNIYFDTMIASFLINSSSSQHNLDNLAQEYLNHKMISIEEVIGAGKNQKLMTELHVGEVSDYACEDADITRRLMQILKPKLKELGLEDLFYNIEMPLVQVLMEMEEQGVTLDTKLLDNLSVELEKDIIDYTNQIYEQAGEEFNINSPAQLGTILFEKLEIHKQLNMRTPKKTKTGQYSTSEQILERYFQHPLPKTILEYRKLAKLKNTYVDALPNLIKDKTGRVHTSYNQTIAATGRLSSINPNLQNIPIRTEIGRQMRKAFKPAEKDTVILSADYSQIELRIMSHLSGDEKMQESFEKDLDIHQATAAQIFNVDISEVSSDQRRKAKEINFGIIYGMSKYGLSNRLEISVDEAETFIFEYFATYPKIQEFMQDTIQFASQNGFVVTMKNRRRYLPQIASTNRQLREFGERTSINTPIQGSAADLIKIAMINVHNAIEDKGLKSKMILQVHDELVFEVPKNEIEEMKKLVKEKMESAIIISVPIKVDMGIGENWLEAH